MQILGASYKVNKGSTKQYKINDFEEFSVSFLKNLYLS